MLGPLHLPSFENRMVNQPFLKKETLKKLLTLHYIAKIIIQRNVLSKLWSLGNFIPLKARTIIIFAKNLNARPYTSCALLTRYISRYLLNFRKITLIKNLVYRVDRLIDAVH